MRARDPAAGFTGPHIFLQRSGMKAAGAGAKGLAAWFAKTTGLPE